MTDAIPAGDLDDDADGELAGGRVAGDRPRRPLATRRGVVDVTDAAASRVAAGG